MPNYQLIHHKKKKQEMPEETPEEEAQETLILTAKAKAKRTPKYPKARKNNRKEIVTSLEPTEYLDEK